MNNMPNNTIVAAVHAEFPGYPVSMINEIVESLGDNAYIANVLAEVADSLELEDVEALSS